MTIERPMFPPVDSTRRAFLKNAASLAAATTASGAAVAVALPSPAEAGVVGELDLFIASAMRELGVEIDEALNAWIECNEQCDMRDRALAEWEKRNPLPDWRGPGEEGYHPTYRSDWYERKQNVMIQLQLGGMKGHRNDLSATYNEAVHRFAELEAHTPSELFFKAGYGYAVDNREGLIAKSVIRDLYNFRTRLLPELVSA
ncbi:MAG: hypothetical protein K2Y19_15345 [Afipia birgiae]|jgi:hypothetical protein|nr:hypothetical protein [Afipia birgiae]